MTSTRRNTALLLTALAVLACSAKPPSTAQTDASDPSQAQSASSQGATANWSATIDGAEVTGNGVDETQLGNAAFVLGGPGKKYSGQRYGFFTLYATPDGQLDKANLTMTFHFPPHAGTFVHAGTFDSCNLRHVAGQERQGRRPGAIQCGHRDDHHHVDERDENRRDVLGELQAEQRHAAIGAKARDGHEREVRPSDVGVEADA